MTTENNKSWAMKWVVLIVASLIFILSSIVRIFEGAEVDSGLCWLFISVSGLIFGAKAIEYFKK
jgi:Co/Zn/Cd efflux system component